MKQLKFFIFLEFFAMIVTGLTHLALFILGFTFDGLSGGWLLYPIMAAIILAVFLLVLAIMPIAEWFLDL